MNHFFRGLLPCLLVVAAVACGISPARAALPDPVRDDALAKTGETRTIVLSGGCFWGVQAVFQHVRGVKAAVAGYAGGTGPADYESVSSGGTGHAESVKVTYDPMQVTTGQILKVFFAVAHDPTQLNRQGPDTGTQYRSAIFFTAPEQEKIAKAYIEQLGEAKVFPGLIVTEVKPLAEFYPAEEYHQDYARKHPDDSYIVWNDLPKVANLKKDFPGLYTGQ